MKKKSKSKTRSYASLKKKIQRWINEAQENLLLQHWVIKTDWELGGKSSDRSMTLATVGSLPEYYDARLTVYVKNCAKSTDEEVRHNVYREVSHLILAEFAHAAVSRCVSREQLKHAEERAVSLLAKIFCLAFKSRVA